MRAPVVQAIGGSSPGSTAAPRTRRVARIERFARFITLRGADTRPAEPELFLRAWEAQQRADTPGRAEIRREIARAQARSGAPPAPAHGQARAVAYPVPGGGLGEDQARHAMAQAVAACRRGNRVDPGGPDPLPARPSGRGNGRPRRPGDPGRPRHQRRGRGTGRAAVRAGMAARPRQSAPRRRRVGVPAARRRLYASQAQLTLEERLLAQAQEPGAPHLDPDVAARLLGADRRRLEAQLQPAPATAAPPGVTGTGCGWIRPPPPGSS